MNEPRGSTNENCHNNYGMGGCALPTAVGLEGQLNSKDVLGDACFFLQNFSRVLLILAHSPMGALLAAGVSLLLFYFLFLLPEDKLMS